MYLIYTGKQNLKYYLFHEGKLLFSGEDFKPSPIHDIDSIDSLVSLLGFLTLKRGDTDPEFFKDYTEEQFKWMHTTAFEELRMMVSDYELKESEYFSEAENYFESSFIN